jgi:hypothetical protein
MIDPCSEIIRHWWQWHPPVGTFIGILGGLGVIVPWLFRPLDKMESKEKALWTLLTILLVLFEMHSLYKDRDEHDAEQAKARCEQLRSFGQIAGQLETAISTNQKQFETTMARSDLIIAGVSDTMKMQTGGDSFAFITFTAEPAQAFEMHFGDFLAPRGTPYFLVSVTSHGKYPLHSARAIMIDDERRVAAMQEYNRHPNGDWMKSINSADTEYQFPYLRPQSAEAPQGEVDLIGLYPMPGGNSKRVTINFSAPNGYWNEVLHLARVNGDWHQCLSVMGPTAPQAAHPFIYCDSDWSEGKALAGADWPHFTRPSKHK